MLSTVADTQQKVSMTLLTLITSCLHEAGKKKTHPEEHLCSSKFSKMADFFSFRGNRDITASSSHLKEIKLATLPQCGSVAQAVAFYWKLPFAKPVFTDIN